MTADDRLKLVSRQNINIQVICTHSFMQVCLSVAGATNALEDYNRQIEKIMTSNIDEAAFKIHKHAFTAQAQKLQAIRQVLENWT